jgi:hypothetical protein
LPHDPVFAISAGPSKPVPAFGFPLLLWRRRPEAIFDEHGQQIGNQFSGSTWKLEEVLRSSARS